MCKQIVLLTPCCESAVPFFADSGIEMAQRLDQLLNKQETDGLTPNERHDLFYLILDFQSKLASNAQPFAETFQGS